MARALPLRQFIGALALVALTAVMGASAHPDVKRTLRVSSGGGGIVTSAEGRIDCGLRCSARYKRGKVVLLTATADRYFAFDHWAGGCVGSAPSCFVLLDRARTVSATFARKTASLTMTVSGPGTIVSNPAAIVCGRGGDKCSAKFPAGTVVTLTPSADPEGVFSLWRDPCRGAGQGACRLVADGDVELLAAFGHREPDPNQPQLSVIPEGVHVTSDPSGIDCPDACQVEFPSGTVVTLHGVVKEWSGLCVGTVLSCVIVLDNSDGAGTGGPRGGTGGSLYGVNVSVAGPGTVLGGQIQCGRTTLLDCEGLYRSGETVVLRARPGRRSRFVFWRGFCTGKKRTCTLQVTAPKTVQALFRR